MSVLVRKVTDTEIEKIIAEAKEAEMCRNLISLEKILAPVFFDHSQNPLIPRDNPFLKAEIYRACGFFLSYYGRSKNKRDYQERGKNFLTISIETFLSAESFNQAADAQIILATCYWHLGEYEECEIVLGDVESRYQDKQLSTIYLRACIFRLHMLNFVQDYQTALRLIEQITIPVEICQDDMVRAMFHNHAGFICRGVGKIGEAINHYHAAFVLAEKSENHHFCAMFLNNLAFLHNKEGETKKAHECVDRGIHYLTVMENTGWMAHFLDTKSLIYLHEKDYSAAERTIDEAIDYFRQGEDYCGLTDALWTKCLILFGDKKIENALQIYGEILQIARERLGAKALGKYIKNFSKRIYLLEDDTLPNQVKNFEKQLIENALKLKAGLVTQAASTLGISHQSLSDALHRRFPELREKFNINRKSRVVKNKKPVPEFRAAEIQILEVPFSEILLPAGFENLTKVTVFLASAKNIEWLWRGAALLCVRRAEFTRGKPVMVFDGDKFECGIAGYDHLSGFYYIENLQPSPFSTNYKCVGEIIGICPVEEISADGKIAFKKIEGDIF